MDMGDGVVAYYVECTGLPATDGFDPNTKTYFVFEKLCPQNLLFWSEFADGHEKVSSRLNGPLRLIKCAVTLQKTTQLYKDGCSEKFDMWIAYVSNVMPTTTHAARRAYSTKGLERVINDATGIEMVVSVLVDREAPITTHSGMFRTYRYWKQIKGEERAQYVQKNYIAKGLKPMVSSIFYEAVGHRNLSTLLHAFAAAAALHVYPHLRGDHSVMVTRPLPIARNIIIKSLRKGDYTIGSQVERRLEIVEDRATRYAADPHQEEYSPEVYEPALGQPYTPLYVEEGGDGPNPTWTLGGKVYNKPEWMRVVDENKHSEHFALSAYHPPIKLLQLTIRLSALARGWNMPN
jgi:hypothetical protein